jgi:hypothetical protein
MKLGEKDPCLRIKPAGFNLTLTPLFPVIDAAAALALDAAHRSGSEHLPFLQTRKDA